MPVQTDSKNWKDGKELESIEFLVLDFLKDNPEQAYNTRELAEEILDIDWAGYEEQWRKKERLPEGEYLDEEEMEDHPVLAYFRETDLFELKMRSLVEKGLVDCRVVDADAFGAELPEDWGEVAAFSYHREEDS